MLRRKMLTFNKKDFEIFLEAIKHDFTRDRIAGLTLYCFDPEDLSASKIMESLFSAQTTYPEYKYYFGFTSAWITYKYLKTQNALEIDLKKSEEIYTRQWKCIIESREQRELP